MLFSDIENSTARTAELGDAKWMELLREHNTIVREQLAAHSGYEVKSMGDVFMLAFGSALDGLRCAIGMQHAFAERNTQAHETIRVRIGLHTGEAIKEAGDFFGSHVNLAARVGGRGHGRRDSRLGPAQSTDRVGGGVRLRRGARGRTEGDQRAAARARSGLAIVALTIREASTSLSSARSAVSRAVVGRGRTCQSLESP